MNWFDLIIVISLVISLVSGLVMGFIRSALALIGLVAGIVIAGRLYDNLATGLKFIHHDGAASIVAFVIIFLAVVILTAIIAKVLRKVISYSMLGWLDHLLGGIAGLLVGALSWGIVLALWAKFLGGGAFENSLVASFLATKFPLVLALLPPEFEAIKEFFR